MLVILQAYSVFYEHICLFLWERHEICATFGEKKTFCSLWNRCSLAFEKFSWMTTYYPAICFQHRQENMQKIHYDTRSGRDDHMLVNVTN